VAELIESGRNGLLFPAGDVDALVDCLLRLADPGRRAAMGRAARATVERCFSEGRMVDCYEELLREVCA
jgi:glycosyltransferase involved in cell wall biosynthesis